MTLAKDIASHLLKIQAVYLKPEEPFTWASGIKSPIYTDNRVTLAYPETRTLIENGFVDAIKEAFPEVEVIAGTATAGIPHGAIIADKMNLPLPTSVANQKTTELVTKSKAAWLRGKRW